MISARRDNDNRGQKCNDRLLPARFSDHAGREDVTATEEATGIYWPRDQVGHEERRGRETIGYAL